VTVCVGLGGCADTFGPQDDDLTKNYFQVKAVSSGVHPDTLRLDSMANFTHAVTLCDLSNCLGYCSPLTTALPVVYDSPTTSLQATHPWLHTYLL